MVGGHGPALKPIHDWVRAFERTWIERLDHFDDVLVELQAAEARSQGAGAGNPPLPLAVDER